MRHPPRYRWFKTLTLFCLLGCGSQPTTQTAGERVIANPRAQNSALASAHAALKTGDYAQVKTLVDSILVSTTHEETKLEARFVMAQAINAEDVGRGSDAFVSLLSDVPDSPLRQKVLLAAAHSSLSAKRCVTAEKIISPMLKSDPIPKDWVPITLALGRCMDFPTAYGMFEGLMDKGVPTEAISTELTARSDAADMSQLFDLLNSISVSPLRDTLIDAISKRSDDIKDRTMLETLLRSMKEEHPYRPRIENRLSRLKIAVLLPLSGRAQHSGKALKDALDRLDQGAQGPSRHRGDPEGDRRRHETALEEAFNAIAADPSVFGSSGSLIRE